MRINKIDLDNLKNDILNSDLKTKPEKELPKLCKQYDVVWKEFGAEPVTGATDYATELSAICAIVLWRKQKQIFMLTSY